MMQSSETNSQILALNNQLYMARYIRNYLANDANKSQLLPANSGIDNGNIESQISEYNRQLLQRNNLVANSSTDNPLVVDMDQALKSMRKAIIGSIDNQIETLNAQIKSLQYSEQQTTSRIAANPTQAKYLLSVERQQKVKEALYLFLLQKREENELSQAFTAYNTRIVTPPHGSLNPTAPIKKNILLVAFAVGLLIPIIIVFMRETRKKRFGVVEHPVYWGDTIVCAQEKRLVQKDCVQTEIGCCQRGEPRYYQRGISGVAYQPRVYDR